MILPGCYWSCFWLLLLSSVYGFFNPLSLLHPEICATVLPQCSSICLLFNQFEFLRFADEEELATTSAPITSVATPSDDGTTTIESIILPSFFSLEAREDPEDQDQPPPDNQAWPVDCNVPGTNIGVSVLVGLFDQDNRLLLHDVDNIRCATYQNLFLSSSISLPMNVGTPGQVACPPGSVITAIWDSDQFYRNTDLVKCSTVVGYIVLAQQCIDVDLEPFYRQPVSQLTENPWLGQCPLPEPLYSVVAIAWDNSGFISMSCCQLLPN